MKRETTDRVIRILLIAVTIIYGFLCWRLHYNQLVLSSDGAFESDLPAHVSMAVDDNWFYSLMGLLITFFYDFTPYGALLTSLSLALFETATVFATYLLLQRLTDRFFTKSMMLLFAILANVIMPFYIALAGKQRYIGYQSPSVWHNSTYILMKLLGTITLIYFLKLRDKYLDGIKVSEWLTFALLLVLCNAAKPSFCFTFDFSMLAILIADLLKKDDRKRTDRLKRIIVFGCSVLPSLLVILWQNRVLFGQDTGNGIMIAPGYALSMRGDHPKVTFILSIAFPLFMLICNYKDLKWDKRFRFIWSMWLFAFLQVFLLTEGGERAADSNFFWGYSIALFFVNLISMVKLVENMKSTDGIYANTTIRTIITSAGSICLAYQCYCGIYFFSQLLKGTSYWM